MKRNKKLRSMKGEGNGTRMWLSKLICIKKQSFDNFSLGHSFFKKTFMPQ